MEKVPKHVTIIMDGNGRWAKERGLDRINGHKEGKTSVREAIEFAAETKIDYLSLFAFSEENWNRPQDEIDALMEMMGTSIIEELPSFMKNNIRFVKIGDATRLSEELNNKIASAMEQTANNTGLTVVIFLSYSGKWDIIQAVNRVLETEDKKNVNIDEFSGYLTTASIPDPDLLIRTSGEQRISNYMLWQCAYTEFVFVDIFWPDFRKTDFQAALEEYNNRNRRFGMTGEQIL